MICVAGPVNNVLPDRRQQYIRGCTRVRVGGRTHQSDCARCDLCFRLIDRNQQNLADDSYFDGCRQDAVPSEGGQSGDLQYPGRL